METDQLVDSMADSKNSYRAVSANGRFVDRERGSSSTDDEMIDITSDSRPDYSDLADKSQGRLTSQSLYSRARNYNFFQG